MFQEGDIIFHKYRIVAPLGSGAFSRVFLVEHINLNIFRALKCINKQFDSYGFAIKEANILKNLRHPAIPIIYDIEENDDCVCIIEDYIEGMSLNSFINNNSPISISTGTEIILQLCHIVEYLHDNGIYHADIKPENILYNQGKIFLLDYGNAGSFDEIKRPAVGTHFFASPEMYTGEQIYEGSDVYSIGVIFLMLITGSKDADALRKIPSKKVRQLLNDCLNHSRKERIHNVSELVSRLNKITKRHACSENVSLRICFTGAYEHSGTTHCALLAGAFLQKSGFSTILWERNESNDFLSILHRMDYVKFHGGMYEASGIKLVPWYYDCVHMENQLNAERIIYDVGRLSEENISFIKECDIVCLVTGGQPYELDLAKKLLRKHQFSKVYTLINLVGVRAYKRIVKSKDLINPIRVGYFPEITKVGTRRLEFGRKKNKIS